MQEENTLLAMELANDINEIITNRGINDCGKNFTEDVERVFIPKIKELIIKERRIIFNKIRQYQLKFVKDNLKVTKDYEVIEEMLKNIGIYER